MNFAFTPFAAALGLTAIVVSFVLIAAWHRREGIGGRPFMTMVAAILVWTLFAALEAAAREPAARILFAKAGYIGAVAVAPSLLVFSMGFTRRGHLTPLALCALLSVPLATLLVVFSNEWHHLYWTTITPSRVPGSDLLVYELGPWWWVLLAYDALVSIVSIVFIGREAVSARGRSRAQAVTILACLAVPWVVQLLAMLPSNPFPGVNILPISFALCGALVIIAISRFRLLDLVPVARGVLLEVMGDGMIVLDDQDRIMDLNPAARSLAGASPSVVTQPAAAALPGWGDMLSVVPLGGEAVEAAHPLDASRILELRAFPLGRRPGRMTGRIVVIRDITLRRNAEKERERLVAELQAALAEVKILGGLLPICANCKKIRDDKGYWQHVEQYISAHSGVTFSHGLCPDCMRKLYPE